MTQGVYQFQLKVTDNNGATAVSNVQVTVNAAANSAPTANAGADQTITLPISTVSLSGSGTDTDGTISAYSWTKISGPASVTITNANSASTTVSTLVQGVYVFQLKVTDNNGATAVSNVQITVNIAPNIPPTADAGADQTITLPTSTVSLSGSGKDTDGSISSYSWTKISGPASGTITNANSASTTVTTLVQGVYVFQLKVTDNGASTAVSNVQITVNPAANIAPTANAGADQIITLPTSTVSLSGSGTDTDGTISGYSWTKISGPASGTITNANSSSSTVTGLIQGVYQFQLKVTDNNGATGVSNVKVTVIVAANIPPTANAGADQSITLPLNNVSLTGSGTDADGTVVSYAWTKISGPAATITNDTSANTSVTGLVQGVYQFQLKVTDNNGATATSNVQVTVSDAANISPTGNAGANQSITLPVNTVLLNGKGTDPDGTISAYNWTKISGPAVGNITNTASAATSVTGCVRGAYKFQLKVTDNDGASGLSTVQITVNVAANIPPTANAGADQSIILPIDNVILTGSGTDAEGTVLSYAWTRISGPAAGTITSINSASTPVTTLVQGLYQYQLKVTDKDGATAFDTVQITVNVAGNIPPTSNAGADQSITLPLNNVSLTGIGTDTDGTVVFAWTKISGPAATITNNTSATTSVTGLVQGVYKFQLKVTDNNGAIAFDTVQITVNVAGNIPPTSNAGADQSITLPLNNVTLSGIGTDRDGTISAYRWTKISGPYSCTITNSTSPSTTVVLVRGVYRFQLRVTDNKSARAFDTVQITVNQAANIRPTANAGADQSITLPTNTVSLNGSGTDPDGTISAYRWTKISGPYSCTITNFTSASTTAVLVRGVYRFQLRVTDNRSARGLRHRTDYRQPGCQHSTNSKSR